MANSVSFSAKEKKYDWVLNKKLLQSNYIVSLQKLLDTYKSFYAVEGVKVLNLKAKNEI